jgi:restriction system protein
VAEAQAAEARLIPDVTDYELKRYLQQMDPFEFEELVAALWGRKGWDAAVDGGTHDRGVDVRATKSYPYESKVLIQAKRYGPNTTVGSPEIQQYASLAHQENGVDKVLVVTTNEFSRQALELARDLNVKTIDGDGLVHIIREEGAEDLVAEYLPLPTRDESGSEPSSSPTKPTDSANEGGLLSSLPSVPGLKPRWHWVVITTGCWAIATAIMFLVEPPLGLGVIAGLAILIAWPGLPIALALDGMYLNQTHERRYWWYLYAVVAFTPFLATFAGLIYLYRRKEFAGLEHPFNAGEFIR